MLSYFRFLYRNKLYTLINVLGLAVAMMFIVLIAKFAKLEFTVDSFQENTEDIYTIGTEDFVACAYGLTPYLTSRYPEIKSVCAVKNTDIQVVNIYDVDYSPKSLAVDTTFLKMFSFRLLEGDRETALDTKDKVIISEEFARRAFHGLSPVGKSILVKWGAASTNVVVGGVFEKIENSFFPDVDFIYNLQCYGEFINESVKNDRFDNAAGVTLFIQTYPGADFKEKEADMLEYFNEFYWIYASGARKELHIYYYNELYFSDLDFYALNNCNRGNKIFINVLMAVAFFILLFALINYINLTVAQTGFRAKEMATRRLLGTSKCAVIMRMISEAILLTIIAFVFGTLFAGLAEPVTLPLLGKNVNVFHDITADEVAVCAALILLVGILAGLVPALMISRFKPVDVVKGSFRLKSKLVFGKVFIMIQNVVTITMLSLTIALSWQFNHLMNKPLNHETRDIMEVNITNVFQTVEEKSLPMLKDELEKLPDVIEVGFSQGFPLGYANNSTFEREDGLYSLNWMTCDTASFEILGFEVITKNGEPLPDTWWITEKAMRRFGLDYDATELVLDPEYNWRYNVCGVIKDYNCLQNNENDVYLVRMLGDDSGAPWHLILKTTGRHAKAMEEVKGRIRELANVDVDCMYLDDYLAETYYKDLRDIRNIILVFSIVALIISILGMVAMSTYYAKQRSKEIAVNKVFGSTNAEAFKRLTGGFLKMFLASFVVAVPIAWFLIDYWLKDYSYKISVSPLIFIGAGLAVFLMAALSILWQSLKAANANPVESLKKE